MAIGRARTTMLTGAAAIVAFLVVPSASTWATGANTREHRRSSFVGRMSIRGTGIPVGTCEAAVLELAIVVSAGTRAVGSDTWECGGLDVLGLE